MSGTQIMVVLIVAMVMLASIIGSKGAHRARRGRSGSGTETEAENARLQSEIAELKKRLAVLERITVEKENSLERQIESLRDR